jgi:hypothetical protein
MDSLIARWTSVSGYDKRLEHNAELLSFLGHWHYSRYQPFPEKPPFWDRLFQWLNHLPHAPTGDQQALFNFVPWLLFASEEDLISTYRMAYTGPICRWLLDQTNITLDDANLDEKLEAARKRTWFGSLAGMDINTFCRVNGIFGQSYRPEFRFVSEFCDVQALSLWLSGQPYERIVVVEDIVGTGTQLWQTRRALKELRDFQILFVPLFIAPEGYRLARLMCSNARYAHVQCEPIFVLPHQCLVRRSPSPEDDPVITAFRSVNAAYNSGDLGFGQEYGTLVLTCANCPDNVPPIVHQRTSSRPMPLFPRASREGS